MVTICRSCGGGILFGNMPWIPSGYQGEGEFCNEICFDRWNKDHPGFALREEYGRCHQCGSQDLKPITREKQLSSKMNVLKKTKPKQIQLVTEKFYCNRCGEEGWDMIAYPYSPYPYFEIEAEYCLIDWNLDYRDLEKLEEKLAPIKALVIPAYGRIWFMNLESRIGR